MVRSKRRYSPSRLRKPKMYSFSFLNRKHLQLVHSLTSSSGRFSATIFLMLLILNEFCFGLTSNGFSFVEAEQVLPHSPRNFSTAGAANSRQRTLALRKMFDLSPVRTVLASVPKEEFNNSLKQSQTASNDLIHNVKRAIITPDSHYFFTSYEFPSLIPVANNPRLENLSTNEIVSSYKHRDDEKLSRELSSRLLSPFPLPTAKITTPETSSTDSNRTLYSRFIDTSGFLQNGISPGTVMAALTGTNQPPLSALAHPVLSSNANILGGIAQRADSGQLQPSQQLWSLPTDPSAITSVAQARSFDTNLTTGRLNLPYNPNFFPQQQFVVQQQQNSPFLAGPQQQQSFSLPSAIPQPWQTPNAYRFAGTQPFWQPSPQPQYQHQPPLSQSTFSQYEPEQVSLASTRPSSSSPRVYGDNNNKPFQAPIRGSSSEQYFSPPASRSVYSTASPSGRVINSKTIEFSFSNASTSAAAAPRQSHFELQRPASSAGTGNSNSVDAQPEERYASYSPNPVSEQKSSYENGEAQQGSWLPEGGGYSGWPRPPSVPAADNGGFSPEFPPPFLMGGGGTFGGQGPPPFPLYNGGRPGFSPAFASARAYESGFGGPSAYGAGPLSAAFGGGGPYARPPITGRYDGFNQRPDFGLQQQPAPYAGFGGGYGPGLVGNNFNNGFGGGGIPPPPYGSGAYPGSNGGGNAVAIFGGLTCDWICDATGNGFDGGYGGGGFGPRRGEFDGFPQGPPAPNDFGNNGIDFNNNNNNQPPADEPHGPINKFFGSNRNGEDDFFLGGMRQTQPQQQIDGGQSVFGSGQKNSFRTGRGLGRHSSREICDDKGRRYRSECDYWQAVCLAARSQRVWPRKISCILLEKNSLGGELNSNLLLSTGQNTIATNANLLALMAALKNNNNNNQLLGQLSTNPNFVNLLGTNNNLFTDGNNQLLNIPRVRSDQDESDNPKKS